MRHPRPVQRRNGSARCGAFKLDSMRSWVQAFARRTKRQEKLWMIPAGLKENRGLSLTQISSGSGYSLNLSDITSFMQKKPACGLYATDGTTLQYAEPKQKTAPRQFA